MRGLVLGCAVLALASGVRADVVLYDELGFAPGTTGGFALGVTPGGAEAAGFPLWVPVTDPDTGATLTAMAFRPGKVSGTVPAGVTLTQTVLAAVDPQALRAFLSGAFFLFARADPGVAPGTKVGELVASVDGRVFTDANVFAQPGGAAYEVGAGFGTGVAAGPHTIQLQVLTDLPGGATFSLYHADALLRQVYVPEPGPLALLAAWLPLAFVIRWWKRRKAAAA